MDTPIRTRILSHYRSGTLYTTMTLRAMGLDFGHEKDRRDGAVGVVFVRDKLPDLRSYSQVFHQVRHPLNVISSSLTCKMTSFDKIFHNIGRICSEKDRVRRAMTSWFYYTEWADTHASWRYRVEDMPGILPELCGRLGVKPIPFSPISTNLNTRKHVRCSWNDLERKDMDLTNRIRDRAEDYGYSM